MKSRLARIALLAVVLLAAGLRLYRIDAQSLWYDEGNSARIAERSFELIIAGAGGDIHPPLYYLVLSGWRAVFGGGEAALRALSALCGALAVLFTGLTLAQPGYIRAGLIAAFLSAVAPFAVYYGQEARMYAPLACCAALSSWGIARLCFGERTLRSGAALYALGTALGLWTHYAYPFVMLAQGAWVLFVFAARLRTGERIGALARAALGGYVLANLVAIAVFAPWLPVALRQISGWSVDAQPYQLGPAALDALRWLVVGGTLPLAQATLPLALIAGLAVLGVVAHPAPARIRFGLFALAALPLMLLFVFNLYRDAYLKFLLVCAGPLMMLAALGIDALALVVEARVQSATVFSGQNRRPTRLRSDLTGLMAGAALSALAAATFVPSLQNLYFNPAYARDDYRGIQRLIAAQGDAAVIFIAPNQWEVYTYYQRSDRDLFPLVYRPGSEGEAAQQLERIVFGRPRVFVLYYAERDADPNGWYERWLAINSAKIDERWVGNIRLALYSGVAPDAVLARDVTLGEGITLQQADADLTRTDGVIPLQLRWRADRDIAARYKVFVHVGEENAPPLAQSDSEPAAGFRPTDTWKAGDVIEDRRGVWLQPGAIPGGTPLQLYVGLYDSATGLRLGERVRLGTVGR
jgi:mannosyltransferase